MPRFLLPLGFFALLACAACSDQFNRALPRRSSRPSLVQPLYFTQAPDARNVAATGQPYDRMVGLGNDGIRFYWKRDSVTLKVDSVWGVRTGSAELQRFVGRTTLRVAELDDIIVYTAQGVHTAEDPAGVTGLPAAGQDNEMSYFFSRTLGSDVLPLERQHVRRQFENDAAFLNELKRVKWWNALTDYSSRHRMYRVNYLYKLAHPKP